MKNFILPLYLISYASGIGTITLAGFYYSRTKTVIVKYLIMTDLFLTLMLTTDTLDIYVNLITSTFSDWLLLFHRVSFLILDFGLVYYVSRSVYSMITIEYTKRNKLKFFLISISITVSGAVMIFLLYIRNLISKGDALNSASVLSNAFIMVGCVFYIIVLMVHWNRLNQMLKKFMKVIIITTFIITPASTLTNVMGYWYCFNFPIAFSPIIYFIFNVVGMVFAARYLTLGHTVHTEAAAEAQNPVQGPSAEELLNQYKLTERELEIVLLVAEGCSNQEIGARLFISPNTVRNHIYNVYQKMNIKNRYELISIMSLKKS